MNDTVTEAEVVILDLEAVLWTMVNSTSNSEIFCRGEQIDRDVSPTTPDGTHHVSSGEVELVASTDVAKTGQVL